LVKLWWTLCLFFSLYDDFTCGKELAIISLNYCFIHLTLLMSVLQILATKISWNWRWKTSTFANQSIEKNSVILQGADLCLLSTTMNQLALSWNFRYSWLNFGTCNRISWQNNWETTFVFLLHTVLEETFIFFFFFNFFFEKSF